MHVQDIHQLLKTFSESLAEKDLLGPTANFSIYQGMKEPYCVTLGYAHNQDDTYDQRKREGFWSTDPDQCLAKAAAHVDAILSPSERSRQRAMEAIAKAVEAAEQANLDPEVVQAIRSINLALSKNLLEHRAEPSNDIF